MSVNNGPLRNPLMTKDPNTHKIEPDWLKAVVLRIELASASSFLHIFLDVLPFPFRYVRLSENPKIVPGETWIHAKVKFNVRPGSFTLWSRAIEGNATSPRFKLCNSRL